MTTFGRIIGADDVHDALLGHLKAWTPAYVAEAARQAGLDSSDLPDFKDWDVVPDAEALATYRLPSLVVTSQGMDSVSVDGDGKVSGRWVAELTVYGSARTEHETQTLIARYAKAVRAAVLQHGSLGGFARGTEMVGEGYAEPVGSERSDAMLLGAASVIVGVWVDAITDVTLGPAEPPVDPGEEPTPDVEAQGAHVIEQSLGQE